MPTTPRNNRPGTGPGRSSRHRAESRRMPVHTVRDNGDPGPVETPATDRPGITRRAVALIVVVLILVMSYASSLRIWIETERENAQNRASIAQSQARIDELNADLARWDDPDYVRAQARDRLGWVMPGETGYRVIGPDGQPIGTELQRPGVDAGAPVPKTWWERIFGSLQAADEPATIPGAPRATPSPKPPITDGTRTPTASPTPRRTPTPTRTPSPLPTRSKTPTPTASPTPSGNG